MALLLDLFDAEYEGGHAVLMSVLLAVKVFSPVLLTLYIPLARFINHPRINIYNDSL